MRILFLSPTLGDAYGQEQIVQITNSLLRAQGHQTFFLADYLVGPVPPCEASYTLPGLSKIGVLSAPWRLFKTRKKLKQILTEVQPDIIHFIDQLDARLMTFLSQQYPCLLTAHTVAPTCPSSQRFFTKQGGVCELKSGWSCLKNHKRQPCLDNFKSPIHRFHAVLEFQFKKRSLKSFSVIGAISPYIENRLKEDGFSHEQVVPIYNPVLFPNPTPKSLDSAPKNLLVVASRLVPLKGIDCLIHCLSHVKDLPWTCWIFGDGPQREELQQLAAKLSLADRILFKGKRSSIEVQRALGSALALIQPNRGPEGFGMAVAEASALGVPVIGYDVPAINDLITHGENGLLAPLNPKLGLSQKIRELLEDPDLTKQLKASGPHKMASKYSADQHIQQTLHAYQKCRELFSISRSKPNRLKNLFQFIFVLTKFLGPDRSRH